MLQVLKTKDLVLYNADDVQVVKMLEETKAETAGFGFSPIAKVRCTESKLIWPEGTAIKIMPDNHPVEFTVKVFARHMSYPLLAAFAVARKIGMDDQTAINRLSEFKSPSGRMNVIPLQSGAMLIRDDYKATFETIEPALDFLKQIPAKRKILVLGDSIEMPKPWQEACRKIGQYIAGFTHQVLLIGQMENEYAAGALQAGMTPEKIILSQNNWKNAFSKLPEDFSTGDVILVKGLAFQRLQRFSLALMGQEIECARSWCEVRSVRCENCSWKNLPDKTFYAQKTFVWELS